jgi:hypothetical protein
MTSFKLTNKVWEGWQVKLASGYASPTYPVTILKIQICSKNN